MKARQLLTEIIDTEARDNEEEQMASAATGIYPSGPGPVYTDKGVQSHSPEEAYDVLRNGGAIEIPNAGVGSYKRVFQGLGFTDVEAWNWTSSAGDWSFTLHDGEGGYWYLAFQENRYPRHG